MRHLIKQRFLGPSGSWRWLQWEWGAAHLFLDVVCVFCATTSSQRLREAQTSLGLCLTLCRFWFSPGCVSLRPPCPVPLHHQPTPFLQPQGWIQGEGDKITAGTRLQKAGALLLSEVSTAWFIFTLPKLQPDRGNVFTEGKQQPAKGAVQCFTQEDLKQRWRVAANSSRKVMMHCFFFKRRKKDFSKRHKEYFYETTNGKECLHQVSRKNIEKTDYLHERSSFIQQLNSVKPKVIDYINSGHAYYHFPNKPKPIFHKVLTIWEAVTWNFISSLNGLWCFVFGFWFFGVIFLCSFMSFL